jgi:hypothetical protein
VRAVLLLALLPPPAAARELPPRLSVEKAAGAEQCPEQQELGRRVEGILRQPLGEVIDPAELTIEVRFARTPENAFSARVTATGPKPGQRLLRDISPTCDALAEAVSVTIALLLDDALPDRHAATIAPGATAPATHSPPADTTPPRAHDLNANAWTGRASLEVGGGYGLAGSGALLGFGRAGARHGRWLFDLGAGANLPREQGFQNGSVRTSLLFGSLRACYLLGQSLLIAPCVQVGAGRLHGEGSGYGEVRAASLPWTAAGLGLAGEVPLGAGFYATLAATLWVPTRRQTFSVENAGIAWESKPLAGVLTAGLALSVF